MKEVEFTEENFNVPPVAPPVVRQSVFVRTLIKMGVVKNEAHANAVLVILVVCMVAFTVFLLWSTRSPQGIDTPSSEYFRLMNSINQ